MYTTINPIIKPEMLRCEKKECLKTVRFQLSRSLISDDVSGRTGVGIDAMVMGLMGAIMVGEVIWFKLGGLGWEGRRLSNAPRFNGVGWCCCCCCVGIREPQDCGCVEEVAQAFIVVRGCCCCCCGRPGLMP